MDLCDLIVLGIANKILPPKCNNATKTPVSEHTVFAYLLFTTTKFLSHAAERMLLIQWKLGVRPIFRFHADATDDLNR